jgi:hypothetical protein
MFPPQSILRNDAHAGFQLDTAALTTKDKRRTIRFLQGWAISVLRDAVAIREWEEHG